MVHECMHMHNNYAKAVLLCKLNIVFSEHSIECFKKQSLFWHSQNKYLTIVIH